MRAIVRDDADGTDGCSGDDADGTDGWFWRGRRSYRWLVLVIKTMSVELPKKWQ